MERVLKYLTPWVVLGAFGVTLALYFVGSVILFALVTQHPRPSYPQAALTVVPASLIESPTPVQNPEITSTPEPGTPPSTGGIAVGMYVQISGTEGDGLRLREAPGTNPKARFIGMESEVFEVREGPQEVDGYIWWYLVAPYDKNRNGWAVSNYLTVVAYQP